MERYGLETSFRCADDSGVLTLWGELDITTLAVLCGALDEAVTAVPPLRVIVVDLAGVQFCGARALGALLDTAARILPHGGRVVLAHRPPAVQRLMDLLSVDSHPCPLPTGCGDETAVELAARVTKPDPALR